MEEHKKQKIALFRYGIIAELTGLRQTQRGEREKLISELVSRSWEIPFSGRSFIGRSTLRQWIKRYQDSGGKLESLQPSPREDTGRMRSLDDETQAVLIKLKRELGRVSLPVLLKTAKLRKLLPADCKASPQSIYRLFKREGIADEQAVKQDMRKYEAELPNDIWQSDCMHGPQVLCDGRLRKSYLFAFIDDHSRLISHGEFYLQENLDSFTHCLQKALAKRGLPRKLYVDNGPSFRSHHLEHVCASLSIALIHATPYRPEGKGKIERFWGTVRGQLLALQQEPVSLGQLNEQLHRFLETDYNLREHSATGEKPFERYARHVELVRQAPKNLSDFFRKRALRKVDRDRTVSLCGRLYEAPVELIGRTITLLYHEADPSRVEVFFQEKPSGFLVPLDLHVNCRVRRHNHQTQLLQKPADQKASPPQQPCYQGGILFEGRDKT
jgi:transposase InsO family protein